MRWRSSIRGGLGERNFVKPLYLKVKELANTGTPISASLERIHMKSWAKKSRKIRVLFVFTRPNTNIMKKNNKSVFKTDRNLNLLDE
jgi:hypothetical protein